MSILSQLRNTISAPARIFYNSALKERASLFVTMFIVPLACLLLVVSIVTAIVSVNNNIRTYERIFVYYLDEMDTSLNAISVYLVNTIQTSRYAANLVQGRKSKNYELNIRNMYLQLNQNISYYPQAEYLFVCVDGFPTVVSSPHVNERGTLSYSKVKTFIANEVKSGDYERNEWTLEQIEDEQYLVRFLDYRGLQIGACVRTDVTLQQLNRYVTGEPSALEENDIVIDPSSVTFSTEKYTEINSYAPFLNILLRTPSTQGAFHTVFTLDISGILLRFIAYIILSCMLFLLIPVSKRFLQRQFLTPINVLADHMRSIRKGDVHILLPKQLGGPEMSALAQTFNHMMSEINELNKRISDERLAERNLEMQCLNMQLDPHFFLNTLNSIFLLSRSGNQSDIQQIIEKFSNYYRSIFQTKEHCLTLSDELNRCLDYANICKLRWDKDFSLELDVPEELLECMVPKMCIQTFMENSFKYAREDITGLRILIEARSRSGEDGTVLEIAVSDNGCGFPDDVLNKLRDETEDLSSSEHIGIQNLVQRMRFLYGEESAFLFENTPDGGAACTIFLPLSPEAPGFAGNGESEGDANDYIIC